MKQVLKPFRQPETREANALRQLLATPGYAQSVRRIEVVDAQGNVLPEGLGTYQPAVGELVTLTTEGAAKHDEILAAMPL